MRLTGRDEETLALVEEYAKAQGMWHDADTPEPVFTDTLELDISTVEPSLAGPKRPQDRVSLSNAATAFDKELETTFDKAGDKDKSVAVEGADYELSQGDVVIAAITSCTNTSNPSVMLAAGLLARNALEKGMEVKPWVKTSLAPGSPVVTDYLEAAGLPDHLDALGFNLVGYGCTTCIGNSGPLPPPISDAINKNDVIGVSVLSGNRNFEGRVNPDVRANYLASPPLVVIYALAGNMRIDVANDPVGEDKDGNPVYLKDIWPSNDQIREVVQRCVTPEMFRNRYADVFTGTEAWRQIEVAEGLTYEWDPDSTYVRRPPFFDGDEGGATHNIEGARILALLGDSITTDHISPAGAIKEDSPAGEYLKSHGVEKAEFNSYGARRGNHEVMMRGTFANIRLRNLMAPGTEGGWTRHMPDGQQMTIYDAAMQYAEEGVPLVVVAGKEYGTGSSRDWAAKGVKLLGVKAVIAESYERIHRSNLIGMGVLPLQFEEGTTRESLGLTGEEAIDIVGLEDGISPRMKVGLRIHMGDGQTRDVPALCRIDTEDEVAYFEAGGILQYVLDRLAA
jgi:aconitate hydratase